MEPNHGIQRTGRARLRVLCSLLSGGWPRPLMLVVSLCTSTIHLSKARNSATDSWQSCSHFWPAICGVARPASSGSAIPYSSRLLSLGLIFNHLAFFACRIEQLAEWRGFAVAWLSFVLVYGFTLCSDDTPRA